MQDTDHLFEAVFAKDYVLARGESSVTISGELLIQEIEETDERGVSHTVQAAALRVERTEYLVDGVVVVPARGDTFTDGTAVYTVAPRNKGRCWELEIAGSKILVYVKRTQ